VTEFDPDALRPMIITDVHWFASWESAERFLRDKGYQRKGALANFFVDRTGHVVILTGHPKGRASVRPIANPEAAE
jgi:hypothetical protein